MDPARCHWTLAEIEREHILDLLTCCHGNRTQVAKILDISIRGLRIKLHDYAQSGFSVCKPGSCDEDQSFLCEFAKSPFAPCHWPQVDKSGSTEVSLDRTQPENDPADLRWDAELFQRLTHSAHTAKSRKNLEKLSMSLLDEAAMLEKDLANIA